MTSIPGGEGGSRSAWVGVQPGDDSGAQFGVERVMISSGQAHQALGLALPSVRTCQFDLADAGRLQQVEARLHAVDRDEVRATELETARGWLEFVGDWRSSTTLYQPMLAGSMSGRRARFQ